MASKAVAKGSTSAAEKSEASGHDKEKKPPIVGNEFAVAECFRLSVTALEYPSINGTVYTGWKAPPHPSISQWKPRILGKVSECLEHDSDAG